MYHSPLAGGDGFESTDRAVKSGRLVAPGLAVSAWPDTCFKICCCTASSSSLRRWARRANSGTISAAILYDEIGKL